jgi:hypothetical protein
VAARSSHATRARDSDRASDRRFAGSCRRANDRRDASPLRRPRKIPADRVRYGSARLDKGLGINGFWTDSLREIGSFAEAWKRGPLCQMWPRKAATEGLEAVLRSPWSLTARHHDVMMSVRYNLPRQGPCPAWTSERDDMFKDFNIAERGLWLLLAACNPKMGNGPDLCVVWNTKIHTSVG